MKSNNIEIPSKVITSDASYQIESELPTVPGGPNDHQQPGVEPTEDLSATGKQEPRANSSPSSSAFLFGSMGEVIGAAARSVDTADEPDAMFRSFDRSIADHPDLIGRVATSFADLLLYHCALGGGYLSPFPETRGLVFASSISPIAKDAMKLAERQFLQLREKEIAPLREELEQLEAKAKNQKRGKGSPMDAVTGLDGDKLAEKIAVLREQVRRPVHVIWRDHYVHKNNVIDLLRRSAHGAMSFYDEDGSRLLAAFCHPSRLAADLSLVSLTSGSADSVMIRASGTGGINVMTLAGDVPVAFNYVCSPHPKVMGDLSKKITDTKTGSIVLGKAIVIDGVASTEHTVDTLELTRILRLTMSHVFAAGSKTDGEKVDVVFEDDGVSQAWESFFELTLRDYLNREVRPGDLTSEGKMPATRRSMALFASRAAMTEAVLSAVERRGDDLTESVVLTREHLAMAQLFAYCLFHQRFDRSHLEARQKNAATARAALLKPEKVEAAYDAITKELVEENQIARSKAVRIEAVTAGLLDKLVGDGRLVELEGIHAGRRSRVYTLPENALLDPEEALAELQDAREIFKETPHAGFGNREKLYNELQRKAEGNLSIHRLPCVPTTHMTVEEVRAIPALLEERQYSLFLRGEEGDPEPEKLFFPEDPDDLMKPGIPNLWFRFKSDGKPMVNWKTAGAFKAPESWMEDDE